MIHLSPSLIVNRICDQLMEAPSLASTAHPLWRRTAARRDSSKRCTAPAAAAPATCTRPPSGLLEPPTLFITPLACPLRDRLCPPACVRVGGGAQLHGRGQVGRHHPVHEGPLRRALHPHHREHVLEGRGHAQWAFERIDTRTGARADRRQSVVESGAQRAGGMRTGPAGEEDGRPAGMHRCISGRIGFAEARPGGPRVHCTWSGRARPVRSGTD